MATKQFNLYNSETDIRVELTVSKENATQVENGSAKMSSDAPSRPMKFPYTFSAKVAQFPLKHYIQNQWIWRYWMAGIVISLPVFYKIHKMANSPENVSKWAEMRKKEAAAHH